MVATTKLLITSVALVLTLLVITDVNAGSLSNSILLKKGQTSVQDNEKLISDEGHNIQRRFVREMNSESDENSKSRYFLRNAVFHKFFPYVAPHYGHLVPRAPSFNSQHHGAYSHQYHNQFFDHHHNQHLRPNHFSHGHYPHHNFHHHHHHHDQDCDHNNSDSSDSSSEENHNRPKNPHYPGNQNNLPNTSPPESKSTEDIPITTTETVFDIDVRLGDSS